MSGSALAGAANAFFGFVSQRHRVLVIQALCTHNGCNLQAKALSMWLATTKRAENEAEAEVESLK